MSGQRIQQDYRLCQRHKTEHKSDSSLCTDQCNFNVYPQMSSSPNLGFVHFHEFAPSDLADFDQLLVQKNWLNIFCT